MNDNLKVVLFYLVLITIVIAGVSILMKFFNYVTIQEKLISPTPGVQCVIVSATDSTSVDCWKI